MSLKFIVVILALLFCENVSANIGGEDDDDVDLRAHSSITTWVQHYVQPGSSEYIVDDDYTQSASLEPYKLTSNSTLKNSSVKATFSGHPSTTFTSATELKTVGTGTNTRAFTQSLYDYEYLVTGDESRAGQLVKLHLSGYMTIDAEASNFASLIPIGGDYVNMRMLAEVAVTRMKAPGEEWATSCILLTHCENGMGIAVSSIAEFHSGVRFDPTWGPNGLNINYATYDPLGETYELISTTGAKETFHFNYSYWVRAEDINSVSGFLRTDSTQAGYERMGSLDFFFDPVITIDDAYKDYFTLEISPAIGNTLVSNVPEPDSYAMFMAGLSIFGFILRMKS